MEVDNDNQLIIRTRLEETMLNIREGNVNIMAFLRDKSATILVDL